MTSLSTKELQELSELLGGPIADVPHVDRAGRAVAKLVLDMRGQLNEAVAASGAGVRQLARKLKISPAAVSRQLRAEGDFKASTAAILADALDRDWVVSLKPRKEAGRNHVMPVSAGTSGLSLPETPQSQSATLKAI